MNPPAGAAEHAVVVRPARPDEYDEVGELTARVFLDEGYGDEQYAPWLRAAATRAAHGELLVAQLAGRLVGTASLFTAAAGPEWAETAAPGEGVLRMLAVDPAARGAGVGSALTTTCIERARALGCHRMLLLTQPSMTTAQRIYTRLGFVRDPGGDWDVRPDLRLLRYTLEL